MINALYEPFPESVEVGGEMLPITTDFRDWLRFSDMIGDAELTADEKICMAVQWFLDPVAYLTEEHVQALIGFYRAEALKKNPHNEETEDEERAARKPPVLDWRIDAAYIIADFRQYYGIDLRHTEYLHWWEFNCLLMALPDDSGVQKRIAYRAADTSQIRDAAEKKRIMKIQCQIAIPFEYDDDMIADVFG